MGNQYYSEALKLQPARLGGWEYQERQGNVEHHALCSEEGRQVIIALGRIWEAHADNLAAWMDHTGMTMCEHGRPLQFDLTWEANTYEFDPLMEPERAMFILYGWHTVGDDETGEFCIPWGYRALGSGGMFFRW